MSIQVKNQQPVVLDPTYTFKITGSYEPVIILQNTITDKLFSPLVQTLPVEITNHCKQKNTKDTLDKVDITDMINRAIFSTVDPNLEESLDELFRQTLVYHSGQNNDTIDRLFVKQAQCIEGLPEPSQTLIYTASDVMLAAKELLASHKKPSNLFANIALAFKPNTLGFYAQSQTEFNKFKKYIENEITILSNTIPKNTLDCFHEFDDLKFDKLCESLLIRTQDPDNGNHDSSFARCLIYLTMSYSKKVNDPSKFGIFPFSLSELLLPTSVVFVNVDAHAKSNTRTISREWRLIQ